MRSQGARAKLFRDWAEDVLYEVMMTGACGDTSAMYGLGKSRGIKEGIDAAVAATRHGLDPADIGKYLELRNNHLTQAECARVFRMSSSQAYKFELKLQKSGIVFSGSRRRRLALIPGGETNG
jgi:hypothetical protein